MISKLTFSLYYGIIGIMITKEVKIKIKTRISDLNAVNIMERAAGEEIDQSLIPEDEIIEYSTDATLTDTGSAIELCYDEDESMGMKNTRTVIVFEKKHPDCVNLNRSGENTTGLYFSSKNKRQNCSYDVGGYTMEFCIYTRKIENSLTAKGGTLEIDYTMEICGTKTQRNRILIKVDEKKKR